MNPIDELSLARDVLNRECISPIDFQLIRRNGTIKDPHVLGYLCQEAYYQGVMDAIQATTEGWPSHKIADHVIQTLDAMEWAESMADAHQCFINRMKYQRENQK